MNHSSHSLRSIPLGGRIPDSPHGVSVSLPTLGDVLAYEEKEPHTMAKVCSGYPRFVRHPYIEEFASAFFRKEVLDPSTQQPFFFSSYHAKDDALEKLGDLRSTVMEFEYCEVCVLVVEKSSETERQLAKYIQHTGTGLSSREAEDHLITLDATRPRFEEKITIQKENHADKALLQWFDPSVSSEVIPCKSGMNAFYAAFQAVNHIQMRDGRRDWISIGWLYLDTMHILDIYLEQGGITTAFQDVYDTERILSFIEENGHQVAGLVLEAPTNPLVQTPDIDRISEACAKAGIMTVMDPSLVSPQNVDLSPYCDIVCCSLTKYAAYAGDVMLGAVSVNLDRSHGPQLLEEVSNCLTPAYKRDLARVKTSLVEAADVLHVVNANTMAMAEYFESHNGVKNLHWAYRSEHADRYEKIQRSPGRPGGVLTLDLQKPIEAVYDALPLPKGPSFGTEFTLVCPYIHLAHYDLMQTDIGRERLRQAGIHSNMIRLSIGTEKVEDLISIFDRCL